MQYVAEYSAHSSFNGHCNAGWLQLQNGKYPPEKVSLKTLLASAEPQGTGGVERGEFVH